MVVVVAVIKAKSGMEQGVENALRDMISKVETEEGTLAYVLHRAKNKPTQFLMYEKYLNEEAFAQHSSSPHFAQLIEKIGPMLDGAPKIDLYEDLVGIKEKI